MSQPTPTARGQALRHADFATLCEALDYAATCDTGFNYFDGKAKLKTALSYSELREQAIELAKRLVPFADKNARIGLAAMADDLCYIQYSSGSSSSPKGIIGTQSSVSANCHGITKYGMDMDDNDRGTSWLPLYHDMGLIGFMLAPLMSQLTVDFMDPQDFTRRPISWLQLINDHKGTLSYSPTFGYELCVRRWRSDRELDLSSWRAAGIGGDMVRPEPLTEFQELFGTMGFGDGAFKPSYGLAETTLAATFAPTGQGLLKHTIDMDRYERTSEAVEATDLTKAEHKRTLFLPMDGSIRVILAIGSKTNWLLQGASRILFPLLRAEQVTRKMSCCCLNAALVTRNFLMKYTKRSWLLSASKSAFL